MSDLADLVEAYKREVAIPGAFSSEFPLTSDDDITAALADAFAEAQLDGYFGRMTLDLDAYEVTPDLSVAGAALVVIYAGIRLARQQLRNVNAMSRYKAGPVEMSTQRSASAISEDMRYLQARRAELVTNARRGRGTTTFVLDGYISRASTSNFYGGFFAHEVAAPTYAGLL